MKCIILNNGPIRRVRPVVGEPQEVWDLWAEVIEKRTGKRMLDVDWSNWVNHWKSALEAAGAEIEYLNPERAD
jgi:hypothetical protein